MASRHERRSPHLAGPVESFAGGGIPGNHTPIIPIARDLSASLQILAERHRDLAPHELEWALWALYDSARELQTGLYREGLR